MTTETINNGLRVWQGREIVDYPKNPRKGDKHIYLCPIGGVDRIVCRFDGKNWVHIETR